MSGKKPMPGYYGKNIVQNAQKRFLRRKALEDDLEKRRRLEERRAELQLYEAEKRSDEYERGERDHL